MLFQVLGGLNKFCRFGRGKVSPGKVLISVVSRGRVHSEEVGDWWKNGDDCSKPSAAYDTRWEIINKPESVGEGGGGGCYPSYKSLLTMRNSHRTGQGRTEIF